MNKALHALVYVILAVAGVALFFEIKLYQKRELLSERNDQFADSIVKVAGTIEKANAAAPANTEHEAHQDVSPVEAFTRKYLKKTFGAPVPRAPCLLS